MYTKKSLIPFSRGWALLIIPLLNSVSFANTPDITPIKAGEAKNAYASRDSNDDDDMPSTGASRELASEPSTGGFMPSTGGGGGGSYSRSGDPEEAAMLVACGLERRPYGRPFSNGRVASNWRWSEVRRDARREIEFSQRRHGSTGFESALCELFIMKRMLEQGGKASLTYRCELVRNDLHRSYANLQAGGGSAGAFGLLDGLMSSGSSDSGERACRNPGTDEIFACATDSIGAGLGNSSRQRQAAENVLNLCVSNGARMGSNTGYYNAGIIANGNGFCNPAGVYSVGNGIAVIQQPPEPWYKTVLNAGLGFFKVWAPLKTLNDAHERREETSQMAIAANTKLGFPSAVQGSGMWGGTSGGCMGYGCGGGYMGGGCMGGACGGYMGGGCMGSNCGGGGYMGGTCGMPPYYSCGGGGGYYPGVGYPGGYPPMGGYPGMGYPGMGYPGYGSGGVPGPFGTLGGGNGWSPNGGYGYGAGYGAGYGYGGNSGYYVDSYNAQAARAQNRSNRYADLYSDYGQDARTNSGSMKNTVNSFGGYNFYPPYNATMQ